LNGRSNIWASEFDCFIRFDLAKKDAIALEDRIMGLENRIRELEIRQLPEAHNPSLGEMPIKTYHSPLSVRRMLQEADAKRLKEKGRNV